MTHHNKDSKLSAGIIFGAIVGGLAAYFFSPRSGKENRDMLKKKIHEVSKMLEDGAIQDKVKEIYGDVSDQGKKAYTVAKKEFDTRLDDMKKVTDDIDVNKYTSMVDEVMDRVREETEESVDRISKLRDYFMDRFTKTKNDVKDDAKKVSKSVTKAVRDIKEAHDKG